MKIGYLMQAGAADVRRQPWSGPAAHVGHVIQSWRELGHTVRLLAQFDEKIFASDDLVNFRPVTIKRMDQGPLRSFERAVRRFQSELHLPYAAVFESTRYVSACAAELYDCDLLYERMGWMGYSGALAARKLAKPFVLEVNGDHLNEFEMLGIAPRGAQRWISVRETRYAARHADLVVATGEGWRRRFIEQWEVDPGRVHVVENGSEVVDLLHRDELAAFQPVQAGAPVQMVYVGALEPWHGVSVLLEALGHVRMLAPNLRLCLQVIGDGSERQRLADMVTRLEIEPMVQFVGFMRASAFAPLLAKSEIGFSPYCGRAEFSGLKLLDYKAAGLVVIASGAGGEPAVLEHGKTGWIVPPCDADALAGAIIALANDAALRRKIGQAARLEAETMHGWKHTAETLLALFGTLPQIKS